MSLNPFPLIKETEKRFNWHRHILRDALKMHATYALGRTPVVAYSMPKTASAAVYKALRRAPGVLALKSHTLRPEHWRKRRLDPAWMPGWTGMWRDHWHTDRLIHQRIVARGRPCRFIALVRDPVATNLSAFVYFASYWFADLPACPSLRDMPEPELLDAFLTRYPHHVTTDWFDLEPKAELGIDVYATPFPHDAGHAVYQQGPFEMLVLRTELPDEAKNDAINAFLGTRSVRVPRFNTSEQHGVATPQKTLKRLIAARPDYVNALIDHRFTAHFWSPAEREAMRARWLGGDAAAPPPRPL